MKLLIVEDESIVREGLESLDWKNVGINCVRSANNGEKAIEILKNEKIDIVLTDIMMPKITGLELSDYIKENYSNIVMIFLTSYSYFEYAKKAIENQVANYVLKPAKPREVLKAMKEAVVSLKKRNIDRKILVKYSNENINEKELGEILIDYFEITNEQVEDILLYLANNYGEEINLSILAQEYHFSSTYLSRLIKRETDRSFTEILTAIRFYQVMELMGENDIRIVDICEKVGIRDQRYFSQLFKKFFGETPNEYKKNLHNVEYTIADILKRIEENKN